MDRWELIRGRKRMIDRGTGMTGPRGGYLKDEWYLIGK